VALALSLFGVAGCQHSRRLGPVAVEPPTPTSATAADQCAALVNRLPTTLEGRTRRGIRPSSRYVAAWGNPAVVLRCGVGRPPGYQGLDVSPVVVNDVAWFEHVGATTVQWTAVDRPVYVELDVPKSIGHADAYLVDLAAAVSTLPCVRSAQVTCQ
jgi:hypothetical protein